MSSYRTSVKDELDRSRDPRHRDRSRSEIRRSNSTDTLPLSSTPTQTIRSEQSTSTNGVVEFFKTLGLNSQLIQALINANSSKIEQIQAPTPPPQQQSLVNNAQDFASFLSKSYGLNSTTVNQPINRDPRRRQISTVTTSSTSTDTFSRLDRPIDPRLVIHSTPIIPSISIDEAYKQFLCSIDQTLLDDETRRYFQRIALLDNELDKLHRMNIELIKTSEQRSRRRTSTKAKDPLLKENENLQNDLTDYIKTLKTTMMNHYSTYMFNNNMIITRQ